MATLKSINVNSIREGDGKVDEGVGFEITLISPPGHEDKHQGRQKGSWGLTGVDFTDVTLVYKDANQHKPHKIILSWPEAYWWRNAQILTSDVCVEDQ